MLQEVQLSGQADSENDLGGSSETRYYIGRDVHKKTIGFSLTAFIPLAIEVVARRTLPESDTEWIATRITGQRRADLELLPAMDRVGDEFI